MNSIQYFESSVADSIKKRYSVRTYKPVEIPDDIKIKLKSFSDKIEGPFGIKTRFSIIEDSNISEKTGGKIGTYGVIKGAKSYIAGTVKKGEHCMEELGFEMEAVILYAASMGVGTCWLGGTFKRSEFAKRMNLGEDEILPTITPIGYAADKKSITESLMRSLAKSNSRKEWNEIFFKDGFNTPLNEKEAGRYYQAFEAVRIAPSASNKQPWRIVKKEKSYHFYLYAAKGYSDRLGFNIQKIDMGIAMCHFEMTLKELGIDGKWFVDKEDSSIGKNGGFEYIATWIEG